MISISCVVLLSIAYNGITKEKLHIFTNIATCKSCNNEALNALKFHIPLFDSLDIDYELILKCRRTRDTEDYRNYYKLDGNLKIVALNDSISKIFETQSNQEYFVLTRNDTIVFDTENLDILIGHITR